MNRIDAHQHFWTLDRGDHSAWLNADLPTLYRDVLPANLAPLLKAARIDRTIAVQGAENTGETEFLLKIAHETPFVAGVVGWVDFERPTGPAEARRLAQDSKLVGLRPMLQDLDDTRWLMRPCVQPTLDEMERLGLRLDALIRPKHLRGLAEFLEARPALPVVIDHAAKPLIAWGQLESWERDMRRVAATGRVFCKLSGIVNNAGIWDAEKLAPYVNVLLDAFGPARLMFGSDWPMIDLAGDYVRWFHAVEDLTSHLSTDDQVMIFGGTAAAFYGVTHD